MHLAPIPLGSFLSIHVADNQPVEAGCGRRCGLRREDPGASDGRVRMRLHGKAILLEANRQRAGVGSVIVDQTSDMGVIAKELACDRGVQFDEQFVAL